LPNRRWLIALITKLHRFVYRVSDGRIGGAALGLRFLLLEHRGRRTGRERVIPLLYVTDGDHWVVAASNGGSDRPPAWWLNLQHQPAARVQVGTAHFGVATRAASEEEAERLWTRLLAAYPRYARYRERAARTIPVVILERAR